MNGTATMYWTHARRAPKLVEQMPRLKVGVVELIGNRPAPGLWNRVMKPNFASIMPQVIAVWCESLGHEVTFVSYTGREDLAKELPADADVLFISAFTHAAQLAYAISNSFRQRGVVTALGGPHARAYPENAVKYFDYVLGFTTKTLLQELLADCSPQRPVGLQLAAPRQPTHLPGIRERWKFIESVLAKGFLFKFVPAISSFGCPYTCSFCVDSSIEYQPLGNAQIQEDLKFLLAKMKHPRVGWHDPNFGVRFDETMTAIEEVVPPGRIDFFAESSLSLLSENRLQRLKRNGFRAILPGIESWYACGNKSKTRNITGLEKVKLVSEHVNTILRYIPYVQANFVLGLDDDAGREPFELTKRFLDLTPGVFPAYSLFSAFGRSAPLNIELQRAGRVLPIPFHFLDNNRAMNVRPKNYDIAELYDHTIDLRRHSFSWSLIRRRLGANKVLLGRTLNLLRAVSSEGIGRVRYDETVRRLLEREPSVRRFLEDGDPTVPRFYLDQVRRDLGPWWKWLPEDALQHDSSAYLRAHEEEKRERRLAAAVGRVAAGLLKPSPSNQTAS
jgi:hypothetical protein